MRKKSIIFYLRKISGLKRKLRENETRVFYLILFLSSFSLSYFFKMIIICYTLL